MLTLVSTGVPHADKSQSDPYVDGYVDRIPLTYVVWVKIAFSALIPAGDCDRTSVKS